MNNNLDMKKIVLWLFGIMIICFLIAGSIMSVKGLGGTFVGNSGKNIMSRDLNIEKTFNVDDIKDMSVSTSSTNISIIPVDTKEVKVHYHGYSRSSLKSVPDIEADLRGNKLVVREKHKINISIGFNFSNQSIKLDVYVPKSYAGSMELNTSSGDALVEDITLEQFNFHSSSGNLRAVSLKAKAAEMSTSSGNFVLKGFSGGLKFSSSSGSLRASDVSLDGGLRADSSSGDINVDCQSFNGSINTNTSSGSVKLKLPQNAEFSVDFNTSSGDFETNFPTTTNQKNRHSVRATVGNGQNAIISHSSSGDLDIMQR